MPGKFLAEFELYVMLAIARLGADAYGASVRQEIDRRTGRPVSVGALYATLHRLERKGLIASREEDSASGPARKYCRLTPEGEAALEHSSRMLQRMMEGVVSSGGDGAAP